MLNLVKKMSAASTARGEMKLVGSKQLGGYQSSGPLTRFLALCKDYFVHSKGRCKNDIQLGIHQFCYILSMIN